MIISIIAAVSANNVIGVRGALPWRLPEDLKSFKRITMGKPMIMGRSTYESIGKALPGRQSIVLTRRAGFSAEGCDVAASPEQALALAGNADVVMDTAGAEIYACFLPLADRIYLTRVQLSVAGDTYFPAFDDGEWRVTSAEEYPAGAEREIGVTFEVLEKK